MKTSLQSHLYNSQDIKSTDFIKIIALITISVIVLLATTILLATNLNLNFLNSSRLNTTQSLVHVCSNTNDAQSCLAMVSNVASIGANRAHGVDQLKTFLGDCVHQIKNVKTMAIDIKSQSRDSKNLATVDVCIHLLDMSVDKLVTSMAALSNNDFDSTYFDVHTWLSGVLTNYDTCVNELEGEPYLEYEYEINDLMARTQVSLAMLLALSPNNFNKSVTHNFAFWKTRNDSNLLEAMPEEIIPDVIVAQDGSGDYLTVIEALAYAPFESVERYIIYVKQGTYVENVRVQKKKNNIMLVGDGMDMTIITSNLSVEDVPTFETGTLIVEGDGFIGQDLWIQNTAGPDKHQAVALRVSSDETVINRCKIDAYQDTLYTHRDRQFYRDCTILGTIDFIFGNSAVVLQNCTIISRLPMGGQANTITAQSRTSPLQNTGISIQMCRIIPSEDLKPFQDTVKSYFGRPWKNCSTTIIMQSYIDNHIDPLGWSKWDDNTNTSLLYYGEYNNSGPGSCTDGRVDWAGFHVITDPDVAMNFTVDRLIQGGFWLNSTGVDYIDGLWNTTQDARPSPCD